MLLCNRSEQITLASRQRSGAFADWLRAAIRARDLSQNAAGERSGVGKGAVSEYLKGPRLPERDAIEKLVKFLGGNLAEVRALVERDRAAQQAMRWKATAPSDPITFLPDRLPPGWKADVRAAVLEGMRAVQAENQTPRTDELRRRRRGTGISIPRIDSHRASATQASGATPSEYVYFDPPDDAGEIAEGRYIQIRVYGECLAPEIVDRDEVVVDRHVERREGDIVLAWHDNDLLVKRLAIIDGEEYLIAEGARHRIDETTRIEGVAISVVRKIARGPVVPSGKRAKQR